MENPILNRRERLARLYSQVVQAETDEVLTLEQIEALFAGDLRAIVGRGLRNEWNFNQVITGRVITPVMLDSLKPGEFGYGPLIYHSPSQELYIRGKKSPIHLERRQADVLHPLIAYPEHLLEYNLYLRRIGYEETPDGLKKGMNNIRVRLDGLRSKIGDKDRDEEERLIRTHFGVGVMLKAA